MEGLWFGERHKPGLRIRSQVRCLMKAANRDVSHIDVSCPLFLPSLSVKKKREKNLIPGFMDLNPGSGDGQFAQLFVPTFLICKTEMQYLIQGILRVKWVIMHVKCLEQCLAHRNDSVNTSYYYLLICSSAEGGDSVKIYRNLTLC